MAAGADPTVRMPGIVLSALMFQHLNSDSDVEGLILGDSIFEEQVIINDTQTDQIHIEEIYNVQKHIACGELHSFYNTIGEVDLNALKTVLGCDKQESVIGWYRQRRDTKQQMSLREMIVHENLKTALANPHIIFLLVTPSKFTASGSTHRTEYAAYILRSRQVINVPVMVNNLGLLEPVSYCKVPALCSAAGYSLTMEKHRSKFFSSNGFLKEVDEINTMNDSLQSELEKLCKDVQNSEEKHEALQAEVSALRRKVNEKKQNILPKDSRDLLPEPKRNMLLHKAVRALFACSPLFHSQTLTLRALPLLDFCCICENAEETASVTSESLSEEDTASELLRRKRPTRKRITEIPLGSEHKRKKT